MKKLSNRIRAIREESELTQSEIAKNVILVHLRMDKLNVIHVILHTTLF